MFQKKFILQAGTTADGVSVIDVVPIDQSSTIDEAPITVSAIIPTGADGDSSPNQTSQQLTAQVAVVQSPGENDTGPHYITVNGK